MALSQVDTRTEYAAPASRARVILFLMAAMMLASGLSAHAAASQAPVAFKDRTAELGLELQTHAACWVDIDNDGWVDLCTPGALWRNNAGKSFARVADIGNAVAADFDNDGFVDLFSWSSLTLHHNNGGKSFTQFKLPELPKCASQGACWGDFNGDGFVDLYIGGYENWNDGVTFPSMILTNNKGKSFELTWSETRYRARGITACDFDRDADLDIYVSNYRLQPNILWLNDASGHFKDAAADYKAVATSPGFKGGHSIGAAWGDFDNDGNFDLFAGNFAHVDNRGDQPKSRFLRNLGSQKGCNFEDLGTCGVYYQESYSSPAAGDYDNDGDLDLFFTTVYETASFGKKNYPVLFCNEGGFAFSDATSSANLSQLGSTYQAAWADFDNDGDLDLATAGKLFENQAGNNHWLKVRLIGDGKAVNRSAIGAQVRIRFKDRVLTRQIEAGTGQGNQNDLTLHFGLGRRTGPVDLEISWPNGVSQTVRGVKTNSLISIPFKPSE